VGSDVVRETGLVKVKFGGNESRVSSLLKGNESPVNLLYQVSPELSATKKDTGNRAATHNARIQEHSSVHFNFFYTWHPGPSQ
jgi:hypothetical protein